MGQTIVALWVSKNRWWIEPTFLFMFWNLCNRILEFGRTSTTKHRYRLGIFPVPHGSVDSLVSSLLDPWMPATPWTWKGRIMSNFVLVRFYVAEE